MGEKEIKEIFDSFVLYAGFLGIFAIIAVGWLINYIAPNSINLPSTLAVLGLGFGIGVLIQILLNIFFKNRGHKK